MQQWLNQHGQAIRLVLKRLSAQWLSTLIICLVIGVTLSIPSLIYVLTNNAQQVLGDLRQDTQISLFLDQDASQAVIDQVENSLKNNSGIKHVVFVSKDEALENLKQNNAQTEAITSLKTNPLPHAFFIEPTAIDSQDIESLASSLKGISGVSEVVMDSGWMKKLSNMLDIGERATWIFGILLGFAIIAVISNTIRMQVVTQKEEIEVSQLFGATKGFIRRPFLYLGSIFGFGGGIIACIIVMIVVMLFNQSVSAIAQAYETNFALHYNPFSLSMLMIAIATLIGWLAAYLAVKHQQTAG